MENQPLNTPEQWDINISILKNPLLWFQLLMVALLASSYLTLLMVGINLFEYHWEDIPASLGCWISCRWRAIHCLKPDFVCNELAGHTNQVCFTG